MCGSVRYRDAETAFTATFRIAQPLQNLHVEMSRRYELMVQQTVDV
jgi:hypothetical protein